MRFNSTHIEIAVANHFNPRVNIIVPNVWWGLGLFHEADLLIVTSSGYATEVEIKISEQDIKNDLSKNHNHESKKIKRFYYAVPEFLKDSEYLPKDCGLITVDDNLRCKTIRAPRINKAARKLSDKEILKLLHLGCMRIWSLKQGMNNLKQK